MVRMYDETMYHLLQTLEEPIKRGGVLIYPNKMDRIVSLELFEHSWEPKETKLFNRLAERSDLVVDVGAYIGWYTLQAARRSGRVVAFEPDPTSFKLMKKSAEANGFHNVMLYNCCVSNYVGTTKLHLARGPNRGNNSVIWDTGETMEVKCVTLDSIFPKDQIDLMKVDVEGAERLVLEGGRKLLKERRIKHILMEWNPASWSEGKYLLEGFEMTEIETHRKVKDPRPVPHDLFLSLKL